MHYFISCIGIIHRIVYGLFCVHKCYKVHSIFPFFKLTISDPLVLVIYISTISYNYISTSVNGDINIAHLVLDHLWSTIC